MTNNEFTKRALDIARNYDTVYLWGTFGAPLTEKLIKQKAKQYPRNYSPHRKAQLKTLTPNHPWAFDCIGLIKGILWGWIGDENKSYGGAVYRADGIPDVTAGKFAAMTSEQSNDMTSLLPGEIVYKTGHIGIYAGGGKVVEATLRKEYDGVVITDLKENDWTGHGKIPWIEYELPRSEIPEKDTPVVGDTVRFSGGKHFTSSDGDRGYVARPGTATVTQYLEGRKHPYHVIHTDKTSNVYGWVDADTLRKI